MTSKFKDCNLCVQITQPSSLETTDSHNGFCHQTHFGNRYLNTAFTNADFKRKDYV